MDIQWLVSLELMQINVIRGGDIMGFLTLEVYEGGEAITGFKVYRQFQQVGTLEKRNGVWIAAFLVDCKVTTFQHESFEFCVNKLNKFI